MSLDIATIRQALRDNYEEPEGPPATPVRSGC